MIDDQDNLSGPIATQSTLAKLPKAARLPAFLTLEQSIPFERTPVSSLGLRRFQDSQYISLDQVGLSYGRRCVFQSLSCSFPRRRISVILGGSGLGKSTILRLIGGLVRPDRGAVRIDGKDIGGFSRRQLASIRLKMGMMFQGGALLDSYTAFENVALPLREQRQLNEREIKSAVHEILSAVDVNDASELYPRQLSGGMLRRVALARAIVRKPDVLLCDEPFSGLDPASIRRMESLLMQINKQLGMTMIVISHDIRSTLRMADHILLVMKGRSLEGSPAQMLESTDAEATEFIRDELTPLAAGKADDRG